MRVVMTEDLWWPLPAAFANAYDVVYDASLVDDRTRLLAMGAETHALIVRNRTRVDAELLDAHPNLRVVGRLGVGLDNIDLAACRDRNVQVVAARGCNAISVAEYVIACLFDKARFLRRCDADVKGGVWNRTIAMGNEVYGKTLGLVGVGDIGQRVATRARALGMHVIAYDPFVLSTSALVQDVHVDLVSLETVMQEAHFISVHVPLTPETRHVIGEKQLAQMRDSAVLINTSRGGTVDEAALLDTLRAHPAQTAYLDVREQEPPADDDLLLKLDNAVCTPHVAGITNESSQRVAEFILAEVDLALRKVEAKQA
ncbi:hydroxyacid dehydrogenase [Alicyclobacillus fodiniaquatilis]|uniref:Hydroxyacid dehydrogenase n=1 Tax=Alicyclobacillus fodiniaquatilis TaxID=1661150 RepID=A0ABW4JN19_9BACL